MLEELAQNCELPCPLLTPRILDLFQSYHWPGNVRELRQVLYRAVVMTVPRLDEGFLDRHFPHILKTPLPQPDMAEDCPELLRKLDDLFARHPPQKRGNMKKVCEEFGRITGKQRSGSNFLGFVRRMVEPYQGLADSHLRHVFEYLRYVDGRKNHPD